MNQPNLLILHLEKADGKIQANDLLQEEIADADIQMVDGRQIQLEQPGFGLPEDWGNIPIKSCAFVEATALVPGEWDEWFFSEFSEACDVSYGDANRTMISPTEFLSTADKLDWDEHGIEDEVREAWEKNIKSLGEIYIDLEN